MKFTQYPERVAGTLFLISVVPVLLAWIILLLVGHQQDMSIMASVLDQIQYMFSAKNPTRLWFAWFALLPVLSAALGVAYFVGAANNRTFAIAMLGASIVLAVASFVLCDWTIAVFVTLPIFWGERCVRRI